MDAKDFIMNIPAPPQQRAQDRGTYVPAQGLLNLQKALGPQGGKLVGRLTGGDAKAWNNVAHKLGIPARTLIAAFYNSSDYVKSCPDIAARLLSGEAVFNGEKIFTADEPVDAEPVDAPVAADEGPHEMPDRVRQQLRAQLARMRGEVPESKSVYIVSMLLEAPPDVRRLYDILAPRLRKILMAFKREKMSDSDASKAVLQDELLAPYVRLDTRNDPPGKGGYYAKTRKIVLYLYAPDWAEFMGGFDLDAVLAVLRHELVHLVQHQHGGSHPPGYSNRAYKLKQQVRDTKQAGQDLTSRLTHRQRIDADRAFRVKQSQAYDSYFAEPIEAQAHAVEAAGRLRKLSPKRAKSIMRQGGPHASEYQGNPKGHHRYMKNLYLSMQQESKAVYVVSVLLDEAMNRRGFLGALGRGLAAISIAPAVAARAAAATPAAPAVAAALPWTRDMQNALQFLRGRWIEKVAGVNGFNTWSLDPDAAEDAWSRLAQAEEAWKEALPVFKQVLSDPDDVLLRTRMRLRADSPVYDPQVHGADSPSDYYRQNLETFKRVRAQQELEPEQAQPEQAQPEPEAQQQPKRQAKRVWPPRQQQGREEPWTDQDIVPESKSVYVVKLLLGEEEDPTAQASADSARVASELIRKKSPARYFKHRSDLEAEKWVTAQKKAAGMAEAVTLPTGFTATRDGDEVEWRYDAAAQAYRFSKFWMDEWTGQRRKAPNLGVQRVKPAEAEQWVQKEMRRWAGGGWAVKRIATSTMAEAETLVVKAWT